MTKVYEKNSKVVFVVMGTCYDFISMPTVHVYKWSVRAFNTIEKALSYKSILDEILSRYKKDNPKVFLELKDHYDTSALAGVNYIYHIDQIPYNKSN